MTAAKRAIATAKDVWLVMKLVIGTPSTIPADTPTNTHDTAFDASSFPTDCAATVKAIETYTGCRKAGKARAISSTAKESVTMETRLLTVKRPNARSIIVRRFTPENTIGITGAEMATMRANMLTVHPAWGTVTPKVIAICGIIPTTPISVLMMPNVPSVSSNTSSPDF